VPVYAWDGRVELVYTLEDWSHRKHDVRCFVALLWTDCNYGGQRPWFECPAVRNGVPCGRRVAKLYLSGRHFLCRHCQGLAYQSQRESGFLRAMAASDKINNRLGSQESFMYSPFPIKPKGMHWETYSRLRRRSLRYEQRAVRALEAILGPMAEVHRRLTGEQ
jgi:hypothetical protein